MASFCELRVAAVDVHGEILDFESGDAIFQNEAAAAKEATGGNQSKPHTVPKHSGVGAGVDAGVGAGVDAGVDSSRAGPQGADRCRNGCKRG